MIAAAAAAVALALGAPPCGLPALRPGAFPWSAGERLRYDVDVMGVVKAGTLVVTAGRPMFEGTQIPFEARMRNTSVFAKIRRITATALSWADARTLLPERYRDESMEDGVRKTTDVRLRGPEVVIDTQFGDRKASTAFPRGREALDLLSALYFLRAADLRRSQEVCFDLAGGRRYWHVRGQVAAAPDRVESAAGIFDTLRLDLVATRADQPSARRAIHVWVATDVRRRPLVAAVSEIDLGPVRAMLVRMSGEGEAEPSR